MKHAKIVAEWDDNKGGANVSIDGNAVDVFTLLVVMTTQIFDQMKLSDSKGLLHLAGGIESARKAMFAKVDLDALKRAKEQRHE
ncbi:MAG: hypothetical protein IJI27_10070 [Oscillospiraceae bacterium]|nr:hypothetical protein [Oscillospiraceae bacterium]